MPKKRKRTPDVEARLTGIEMLRRLQRVRDSHPLPSKVGEMYSDGKLKSEYVEHRPAEAVLQRRHAKSANAVSDRPELPIGLRQAFKLPLIWNQLVQEKPWAVRWIGKDGEVKEKKFGTLGGAVSFWLEAKQLNKTATVVSRCRSYDIPPKLRGKLPKPWKWCPRCMTARKYKRVYDEYGNPHTFYAMVKYWDDEDQKYKWSERSLALTCCTICGNNNRDPVFRRSNQPWEVRKIKKGVRRVKRRRK